MFLHISLFQKRYPMYKYMVIGCVTLGVAIFTLHNPSTAKKAAKKAGSANADASKALGLFLLGVNLLFDGLTNTVQDHIFSTFRVNTASAPIPPNTSPTPSHCIPVTLCPNSTTLISIVSILRVTVTVTSSSELKCASVWKMNTWPMAPHAEKARTSQPTAG